MVFAILRHTPPWVFILFVGLLVWGYAQARTRTIGRWRVYALPVTLLGLSFYGGISAFGAGIVGWASWLAGSSVSVAGASLALKPEYVHYRERTGTLTLPGSWCPLLLMMTLFFTKYGVGMTLARQPALATRTDFAVAIGFVYGFLSGLLFARRPRLRHVAAGVS